MQTGHSTPRHSRRHTMSCQPVPVHPQEPRLRGHAQNNKVLQQRPQQRHCLPLHVFSGQCVCVCVLFVTRGPVNSGLKLPTIDSRAHQSIMPPKVTMAPPKPSVRFSDRSATPMGTTSSSSSCVTWGLLIQTKSCRPVATGDTNPASPQKEQGATNDLPFAASTCNTHRVY
jgi:hypothetical protein